MNGWPFDLLLQVRGRARMRLVNETSWRGGGGPYGLMALWHYGLIHILCISAAAHMGSDGSRCVRYIRQLMKTRVPMLDWSSTRGEKGCSGC